MAWITLQNGQQKSLDAGLHRQEEPTRCLLFLHAPQALSFLIKAA